MDRARRRPRLAAVAQMAGVDASPVSRVLRSARTMTSGLLLPGFSSQVYSAIAHGVEE